MSRQTLSWLTDTDSFTEGLYNASKCDKYEK